MNQRWEAYPFGGLFALSLVAFLLPGPALPPGPDVSDKVEHAAIFLALALAGRFAGWAEDRLLVGLFGYAVLTELLQGVLPIRRDADWHDVLADTIGLLIGLLVVRLLGRIDRWWAARREHSDARG